MVIFHSYVKLPEGNHVGPLDELPQFDMPSLQLQGLCLWTAPIKQKHDGEIHYTYL